MKDSDKKLINKLLKSLSEDLEKEILEQIKTKKFDKKGIEKILEQIDTDILNHKAIKQEIIEGSSIDSIKGLIERIESDVKEKVEMLSGYDEKIAEDLDQTVNDFSINKKIKQIEEMDEKSEYSYGSFDKRYNIVKEEKEKLEKQRKLYNDVKKLKDDGKLNKVYGKNEIIVSFKEVENKYRTWGDSKRKLDKIRSFDFKTKIDELNRKLDNEDYVKSDEFKTRINELKEIFSYSEDKELENIKNNDIYTNNSKDYKYDISKVRKFVGDLSNIDFSKIDEIENYDDKVEELNSKFKDKVKDSIAFLFNPDEKKRLMDALDGKGYNIVDDVINAYIRPKFEEINDLMPKTKQDMNNINDRYNEVNSLFYQMESVKNQGYSENSMETPDEKFSEMSKTLDLSEYGIEDFEKIELWNENIDENGDAENETVEVDFTKVDETNKENVIDALYQRYIYGEDARGEKVEDNEKLAEIQERIINSALERNKNLPLTIPKEGFFAKLWSRITKRPTKREVFYENLIKSEFSAIIDDRKREIESEKKAYTEKYEKNQQFARKDKEEENRYNQYQREAVMDGKTKAKDINKYANEHMRDEER